MQSKNKRLRFNSEWGIFLFKLLLETKGGELNMLNLFIFQLCVGLKST
jgi:hypothetical protein